MRPKSEAVFWFARNNDRLPKSLPDWREQWEGISRGLDDHPEILDVVHEHLKTPPSVVKDAGRACWCDDPLIASVRLRAMPLADLTALVLPLPKGLP